MQFWVLESTSRKRFNPLARFIMWKQKTSFSHLAVALFYDTGEGTVYHATWPKPVKCTFEEFFAKYYIQSAYKLKDPTSASYIDLIGMLEVLIEKNQYYSLAQLLFIYLQIECSKLKTVFKMAILNHERGLICSELLARFLHKGWGLGFKSNYDSIDLLDASEKARSIMDEKVKWQLS